MFVCKNELYYDCKGGWTVSLRGFAFNGESSDYVDENYLMYDAFDQWTFRMEDFSFHIRNNQIQYVEKDVFLQRFHELLKAIDEKAESMLSCHNKS